MDLGSDPLVVFWNTIALVLHWKIQFVWGSTKHCFWKTVLFFHFFHPELRNYYTVLRLHQILFLQDDPCILSWLQNKSYTLYKQKIGTRWKFSDIRLIYCCYVSWDPRPLKCRLHPRKWYYKLEKRNPHKLITMNSQRAPLVALGPLKSSKTGGCFLRNEQEDNTADKSGEKSVNTIFGSMVCYGSAPR